jgi:hypothetical protein
MEECEGFWTKNITSYCPKFIQQKNEITKKLSVDRMHINILCLTEHWLRQDQLDVVNIDHFRLVSKYCRNSSSFGGS